jgi:alkanesulfonate monooxygenase SsuD/methylene tetrahydromethanopterin reductase-like flavin-dependent oxidoreductase (luciferase family)
MRFGIFGAAQAGSPRPGTPMGQGFHDFIDFNVEAEALGYHSTFLVEHHFTGWNQVSAATKLMVLMTALLFSQPRSADGDGPGYHFRPGPQLAEWIKLSYAAPRGKKPNHLLRHA